METKTKEPVKKTVTKTAPVKKVVTKTTSDLELIHKTVSNLTDIVTVLQNESVQLKTDVKRIKIRMGI
jgi:phosphoenolpyruvate carboxylase|tara:strand:+ start:32 stop:235 length:204 start_codon:yes stop_codon:yes gene_type:complete